jgi:DNA polymerase III sliding clamp (beta) subunit (PCNA family)
MTTIKFTKEKLAALLALASPYLNAKNKALSFALQNGNLKFFTSDFVDGGSIMLSMPIGKKVKDMDWMAINGHQFKEMTNLAGELIEIGFDTKLSTITMQSTGSKSEFRAATLSVAVSAVKFNEPGKKFTVKGRDFNVIATITEAASDDDSRPTLAGVYIAPTKDELETAAADGYVLSYATFTPGVSDNANGATYSVDAIQRVKRSLKLSDDEELNVRVGKSGMTITAQRGDVDVTLHAPIVSQKFVDYKPLLKIPTSVKATLPTDHLERMVKVLKSLEGSVYFQVLGGVFWYFIKSDNGNRVESMALDGVKGESPLMHFQLSTLKNVLKACAANGSVELDFPKESNKPLQFKGKASAIAMPLVCDLDESPFKNYQPTMM